MDRQPDNAPLYAKIKRELVSAIQRGDFHPDQPFVTQRELCERYGVSTTTAVRALNDLVTEGYLVRERGRGTFVAPRPDPAPAPAGGTTIACLVHGSGPHIASLVEGVESGCAERGWHMVLTNTQNRADLAQAALSRALDLGAAGVVFYPVEGQPHIPALAALRTAGVPLVSVDRYRGDVATDAVLADNFAVGYRLTEVLLEHGHRNIATLWGETDCSSVRDRLSGHIQALRAHGVPVRPDRTLLRNQAEQPEKQRLATLRGLLGGTEPATALLCANGHVLATTAHDLAILGVETPGQVELASMGDDGPLNLLQLTLVTAVLPSRAMGEEAMRLLAERIRAGRPYDDPSQMVLPIEVRVRDEARGYLRVVGARAVDAQTA
jgi:GntR family transcriptional regulator, arabinose operon transcriptional repressor